MNIRIANRLLEFRRAKGYSQEELAAKIGVSRQAVSKWERVEASPDTDNLIALADLYGVTIDELINGSESPEGEAAAQGTEAGTDTEAHDDEDAEGVGADKDGRPEESECGEEADGKQQKKDRVDIGLNGIHIVDKDGDEVHVSLKGIHIEDKNGEKVHIDPGDIHVHNNDGETVVETRDGKIYVNDSEHKHAPGWFVAVLPMLAAMSYLILGFTVDGGWRCGWLLFFLVPVLPSLIVAINSRKASRFAFPVLVTGLYLTAGMVFGRWHPEWIIFFTIPIYYTICEAFEHNRRKSKNKDR